MESGDFFVLELKKMKKWQIESMFWVMGDGTMTKDERNDDEGQKCEEKNKKKGKEENNWSI